MWLLAAPARTASAQDATEIRQKASRVTTAGVDYSYQSFMGDIDAWQLASFSLGQRSTAGTLIARVNYAHRFATSGVQVEGDAYPRLGDGTYAYLNAGYSGASIFPEWRFGAEVFTNLPQAWEASLGMRHLRFTGAPVTLFTGSLGKYAGNFWLSARPYLRSSSTGTSASASLTARRYYEDADNYIGLRVGYGSTPGDQLTPDVLARSNSFAVTLGGSHAVTSSLLGTWSAGGEREELSSTSTRNSWTISGGLKVRL